MGNAVLLDNWGFMVWNRVLKHLFSGQWKGDIIRGSPHGLIYIYIHVPVIITIYNCAFITCMYVCIHRASGGVETKLIHMKIGSCFM